MKPLFYRSDGNHDRLDLGIVMESKRKGESVMPRWTMSYDDAMRAGFVSLGNMWLKCHYCEKAVRVGREAKVHRDDCPHRPRMNEHA